MRLRGTFWVLLAGAPLLSACGQQMDVQPFQNWTRVSGPTVSSPDSTDAQAAAALCWHDGNGTLRPNRLGEDSWPTRYRIASCMRQQGFVQEPTPPQVPRVVD